MKIPRDVAICRRCAGDLRLATLRQTDVIVCDLCERFTYAPSLVVQWARDIAGEIPRFEKVESLLCP